MGPSQSPGMKTRVGLGIVDDDDVVDDVGDDGKEIVGIKLFHDGELLLYKEERSCCTRKRAKGVSKTAGVRLIGSNV